MTPFRIGTSATEILPTILGEFPCLLRKTGLVYSPTLWNASNKSFYERQFGKCILVSPFSRLPSAYFLGVIRIFFALFFRTTFHWDLRRYLARLLGLILTTIWQYKTFEFEFVHQTWSSGFSGISVSRPITMQVYSKHTLMYCDLF